MKPLFIYLLLLFQNMQKQDRLITEECGKLSMCGSMFVLFSYWAAVYERWLNRHHVLTCFCRPAENNALNQVYQPLFNAQEIK